MRVTCTAGLLAAVLAGCGTGESPGFGSTGAAPEAAERDKVKVIEPAERELAPDISGTTLRGGTLSLDSYRGKVVVLNFWASWCAPCRDEVPVLQKVRAKTHDQGVRFVGVNTRDSRAAAKAFVRNFGIEYPSIYDQPGEVALRFRGTVPPSALPSTIVLDRRGRVAGRIIGEASYAELMPMVRRVVGAAQAEFTPETGRAGGTGS